MASFIRVLFFSGFVRPSVDYTQNPGLIPVEESFFLSKKLFFSVKKTV